MFPLKEIGQVEHTSCSYLKMVLDVEREELVEVKAEVDRHCHVDGVEPPTTSNHVVLPVSHHPLLPRTGPSHRCSRIDFLPC